MPNVADGANATITVVDSDVVSVIVNGGAVRYENPVGTLVAEFGSDSHFGPLQAGSIKLSSVSGAFSYEVWTFFADGGETLEVASYAALRAYTGAAKSVYVTGYLVTVEPSGIAGQFARDDSDTTSADNGGTIIVASNGKRWKRADVGAVNVRWFDAIGNGVADDTAALAAALAAAAGKSLFFHDGTYTTTEELLYAANVSGPIRIYGGPNAILKLTGATNKGIHITGVSGVTRAHVTIDGISILQATSGVCPAAIHLDGISDYQIHNVTITSTIVTNLQFGIKLTGAQQGEISGGYIAASTGIYTELSGLNASNGCDLHGVSLNCTTNIDLNSSDTFFIRSNHMTGGVGVKISAGGFGMINISDNHIEPTNANTSGILLLGGGAVITGNTVLGTGTAPAVDFVTCDQSVFANNLVSGNGLRTGVGCSRLRVIGNWINGTITDNSASTTSIGNFSGGGGVVNIPTRLTTNQLDVTSSAAAAQHIAHFKPNSLVSGNWGVQIDGAGSGDIYTNYGTAGMVGGSTSGAGINFKSAPGGTRWGGIGATALDAVSLVANGAAPTLGPSGVAYGGTTATTVGAAGGAAALPATPLGYIIINVAGAPAKIAYYNT